MNRLLFTSLCAMTCASAAPAMAHPGAGVVHFLTQPDHVFGLVVAVVVPAVVWLLAARLRNSR
jgi:hypothetical protein